MDYNTLYANAIARLSNTYRAPAYAEARENLFKTFEILAAAGCVGRVEDFRISPIDYNPRQEDVDDMERMIEILHRVNYPMVGEWEEDLRVLKSFLICQPA